MFKAALAGTLTGDKEILSGIDDLLLRIRNALSTAPGDTRGEGTLRLVISPAYTDASWMEWIRTAGYPVKCIQTPEDEKQAADQSVCLHTKQRDFIGENLCADADLLIAVWDETPEAHRGSTLELLRMARRKKLPCVWFSSRSGKEFWPEETLFMPFSPGKLQDLCKEKLVPVLHPGRTGNGRTIPFLWVGMRLQAVYLKKYRAAPPAVAPAEDRMLKEDYTMPEQFRDNEPLRRKILASYTSFDQAAIALNARYQGAAYWQAILPFILTGFLALGFYSEDILGALSIPVILLQVLSGIGFLMNAFLLLYKYRLDKSRLVRRWQTSFVQDRGIAELLRVIIHFIPFGVGLDVRALCADDPAIYRTVREITSCDRPGTTDVGPLSAKEVLTHLKEMLEDQLAYHEASVLRYSGIVKTLNKWGKVIAYTGSGFVVIRALFKFSTLICPVPEIPLGNVTLRSFVGTGANMLAMLLPAWAAYFTTKLSQCSFQYNLDNHRRMVASLRQISEQVDMIENNFPEVSLEYVSALGESVARTMLEEDTSRWIRWYRRGS